jgi:hypothetical protein
MFSVAEAIFPTHDMTVLFDFEKLLFAVTIDRHINTKTDLESCISFIARIASADKGQGGNQLDILIV